MRFRPFFFGLPVALWHMCRSEYYRLAHNHAVDNNHPDAVLLCRRMLDSQSRVTDFVTRCL